MSRYFAFFALLALAAAYPASDDFPRPITTITESDFEDQSPWFRFPPFGNIFAPLTKLFSSFADIGPRIEVDDDKFSVIVNVKDYKKEDLKVKVKGDYILVQGAHEAKHDDHDLFASQFFHTYSLPLNASASDVTAILSSDGYLNVTAPVNGADDKNKVVDREVPIVESGKPLKEDKEPVAPVASVDPVENVDKTENVDKIETFDTPVEPLAKVENADKVENLDAPVEPIAKADNVETIAVTNAPLEPLAKVENIDNVETRVAPEEPIAKVENVDKVESPAAPAEPVPQVENVDKVETPEAPVEPVAKVENVDKVETPDVSVKPLPEVENADKVEQQLEVTTEAASEVEEKKEATTTQAPAREEVTEGVQDIKLPQDNEVNEIQP